MESMTAQGRSLLQQALSKALWYNGGSRNDDYGVEYTSLVGHPKILFFRKKNKPAQIYVANGIENWNCLKCETPVLRIEVSHPLQDMIFPLSGSGRSHEEMAPYCPSCEERPSPCGSAITTAGRQYS